MAPILFTLFTSEIPQPSHSAVQLFLFSDDTVYPKHHRNNIKESPGTRGPDWMTQRKTTLETVLDYSEDTVNSNIKIQKKPITWEYNYMVT